jgi:hypothetical protein
MTEIEKARLKADIAKIKEFYGEGQLKKAIEELFELINAIVKYDKENIILSRFFPLGKTAYGVRTSLRSLRDSGRGDNDLSIKDAA